MKIIVLGAGLVGGPMALDLAADEDFVVTVVDKNKSALEKLREKADIKAGTADLSNPETVTNLVKDFDLVVNSVPGFMGFNTLKAVIEARRDVVDIAFFPEDPFKLHDLAVNKKVTAIVDCGVAPGMSNVLISYAAEQMEYVYKVRIFVGGLPEIRRKPFEYKAVFSPVDVLQEYTRPARLIRNGRIFTIPALTEVEELYFPQIGTLEAFNSDGLRTLLKTIKAADMAEKTMRYPGHAKLMEAFRDTGFFSDKEVQLDKNTKLRPVDLTAKLFIKDWRMAEGEVDFTVMKIIVEGRKQTKSTRFTFDLFDRRDEKTGIMSMARTTGYTATAAVRLLANGLYKEKGISPPEYIGKRKDNVDFMLRLLRERGVVYDIKEENF